MAEIKDWVSVGKDVATVAAAAVGLYFTRQGLHAWRVQLLGKTEYDLARRLLISVYKMRNEISQVRTPFMSGLEYAGRPGRDPAAVDVTAEDFDYAYRQRWRKLQEVSAPYQADVLEAESLWGDELREPKRQLGDAVHDLMVNLQEWVESRKGGSQRMTAEYSRAVHAIVFRGPIPDPFAERVGKIVEMFEQRLRPHLKR